jgi:thiol-disulfide isomerase/thioredoxin
MFGSNFKIGDKHIRPYLVLFWMDGCSICRSTKTSLELTNLDELVDIIVFSVHNEASKITARQFKIPDLPTLMVFDAKGNPVESVTGKLSPVEADVFVRSSLAGILKTKQWPIWHRVLNVLLVIIKSIVKQNIYTDKNAITYRELICEQCPALIRKNNKESCNICKCPDLAFKRGFSQATCPKGLW